MSLVVYAYISDEQMFFLAWEEGDGQSTKFPGHGKLTLEMFFNPWHTKLWLIQKVPEISGRWISWEGYTTRYSTSGW